MHVPLISVFIFKTLFKILIVWVVAICIDCQSLGLSAAGGPSLPYSILSYISMHAGMNVISIVRLLIIVE